MKWSKGKITVLVALVIVFTVVIYALFQTVELLLLPAQPEIPSTVWQLDKLIVDGIYRQPNYKREGADP